MLSFSWGATFEAYVYYMCAVADSGKSRFPSVTHRVHDQLDLPGVSLPVKRKRGSKVKHELPMTLKTELRNLLSSDGHAVNPVMMGTDRREDTHASALEAWKKELSTLDVGRQEVALISLCTSESDDKQLEFGRVARTSLAPIPDCCYGKDCVAFKIMGVNKPLQQFLTPSEQHKIDTDECPVFEPDGACLLCIRHIHEAMQKVCARFYVHLVVRDLTVFLSTCKGARGADAQSNGRDWTGADDRAAVSEHGESTWRVPPFGACADP